VSDNSSDIPGTLYGAGNRKVFHHCVCADHMPEETAASGYIKTGEGFSIAVEYAFERLTPISYGRPCAYRELAVEPEMFVIITGAVIHIIGEGSQMRLARDDVGISLRPVTSAKLSL
jgi:hypothetical protein